MAAPHRLEELPRAGESTRSIGRERVVDHVRRTERVEFREVIRTARRLFLDQGYPATTMAEIAETSGTPPATVYRLFGSKRDILKEVLDVTLGGDEPIDYQSRPEVQAALATEAPGALARRKALRTELAASKAADIVYAVTSPEVFRILTVERGWSEDEDEAWLARTLRTQLLAPGRSRVE